MVTGANFENASYGLSLCAETVAIATASAAGRLREIVAIGVIGGAMDADGVPTGTSPVSPCGRCRQVINEAAQLGGRDLPVHCGAAEGTRCEPIACPSCCRMLLARRIWGSAEAPRKNPKIWFARRLGKKKSQRGIRWPHPSPSGRGRGWAPTQACCSGRGRSPPHPLRDFDCETPLLHPGEGRDPVRGDCPLLL